MKIFINHKCGLHEHIKFNFLKVFFGKITGCISQQREILCPIHLHKCSGNNFITFGIEIDCCHHLSKRFPLYTEEKP